MTEAGASSWVKQVVGAGSLISLLYRSRVYYLPIIWEQGVLSPYYIGAGRYYLPSVWEQDLLSSYYIGAGCVISLLCGSRV